LTSAETQANGTPEDWIQTDWRGELVVRLGVSNLERQSRETTLNAVAEEKYMKTSCSVAFIWLAFILSSLHAQGVATARLAGTLTDASGAVLVGAMVQAKNLETGSWRSTVSDSGGRFAIADLPIGSYDVRVSATGLDPVVRSAIVLTVGADLVIDFTLKVGQARQDVLVSAQVSRVETQTAAVSSLVTSEQLHTLPLNGRNFEQLIALVPGVSQVPASLAVATTTTPSNPIYGNQNNYSISGSRPVGTAFLLDNTEISDFFNHATGSDISGSSLGVDAIAEFQVLTNTYSAQFGGTGSAVNIASKSGTNQFHGTAYEFLRNNDLDSRGYFDIDPNGKPAPPPPYRRNQFGGNLGGPIKRKKLFFFVNDEGLRSSLGQTEIAYVPESYVLKGKVCNVNPQASSPGATTCPAADLTQTVPMVPTTQAAILSLYPRPSPLAPDLGGYAPFPESASLVTNENYFLGRMDYLSSSRDSLFARYVVARVKQTNPFAGSPIPLWPDLEVTRNQYVTVEEHHVFGPSAVNLLRASFVRTYSDGQTTNEVPTLNLFPSPDRENTAVTPGGGLSGLGPNGSEPFQVSQNKTSVGDDFLWTWRAHRLTAGASVTQVQSRITDANFSGGNFVFFSLSHFFLGAADLYDGSAPPGPNFDIVRGYRQVDFFPYIQDDWKVARKLTLNLGLRWDFATNAVGIGAPLEAVVNPLTDRAFTPVRHVLAHNPNWANLDPRFGLAFDPFADHKTSVRAGFGIFHEQVEARTYGLGYDSAPPSGFVLDLPPAGGIPFPTIPSLPYDNFLGISYERTTHAPYVIQYNLTLQREMFGHTVLSVSYAGSHGVHLFSLVNENLPVPCSANRGPLPSWCPANPSGTPGLAGNPFTGLVANPNFGTLDDATPTSSSSYNSLQTALNRQFGTGFQAQVSFTWSKCTDIGSATAATEGSFGVVDPYEQALDRGPCAFNRNLNLAVNALYSLPFHRNRLVSGWRMATLITASSGLPINIVDGFDESLGGNEPARPSYSGAAGCHPYEIQSKLIAGPAIQYFNPACYTLSALGTEGNVGRDSIYGPGFFNVDFSILKRTKITEKLDSEFRAEIFNLFNRANFGQPNAAVFTGPTAGQITTLATPPRQVQLALKLLF
jgi:Carboxypeptidase regulatory-like domain/TonB-dependent Receptor Plug Domain